MKRSIEKNEQDIKGSDPPQEERRNYLKTVGTLVAGLAVGGAVGWLAKPSELAEGPEKTVTQRITETRTETVTALTTPTQALAGRLEFWHSYTQPVRIDAIKDNIDKFTAMHPDVSVEQVVMPWGEAMDKWLSAWKTKTGPDIQSGTVSVFYGPQGLGAVIPIDDVYQSIGATNFPKPFIDGLTIEGKVYGLPIYSVGHQLIYRRDWVDEPPENWDEWYEVAKKLTDKPNRYGYCMAMTGTYGLNEIHMLMRMNGGEWFDEDLNINFNIPQNVEAVEFMMKMFWDCSPEGLMTSPAYRPEVTKGQIAMVSEAMGWFIVDCQTAGLTDEEILEKYNCAWEPLGPSGDKETAMTWADYKEICIGAERPHEDVSKEFLKFFYQDENYVHFINSMPLGMIPCTFSAQEAALQHPSYDFFKEYVPMILDTTNKGDEYGLEHGYNPYCTILQTGYVEEMLQKIALKEYTPKDGVAKMDAKLREMLEEARQTIGG